MLQKKRRLPFRYLEPAFFAGLLDDPLLFLRIRPLRRALLFDCGQINHHGLLPGDWVRELKNRVWKRRTESRVVLLRRVGDEIFLNNVTLLCADCSFLAADIEKARNSYHLCTVDLNDLALRLAPRYLLPMHLSKSYLHRTTDLYQELHPPPETSILPLPNHLVPAPLMVQDVEKWLCSPVGK